MHSLESIQLEYVSPDEPGQAERIHKKVWQWFCPGNHAYPLLVTEYENDPAGTVEGKQIILADPYCRFCRNAQSKHAQMELSL